MLDKHDCFIQTTEGKVLCKTFSFANNYDGFEKLYAKIRACNDADIRVELESTGHYSYNLPGFLLSKELPTFVFNPLQTNQFRKSLLLRKIKTDKVDAKTIALMLVTESGDHAYSLQTYQNEELKSLTRYRFDKVGQCAKLKQSISRLVSILFLELESAVSTIHLNFILWSIFWSVLLVEKSVTIRLRKFALWQKSLSAFTFAPKFWNFATSLSSFKF